MKSIKTPETIEELQGVWDTSDKPIHKELPDTNVSAFGELVFFACSIGVLALIAIIACKMINKS